MDEHDVAGQRSLIQDSVATVSVCSKDTVSLRYRVVFATLCYPGMKRANRVQAADPDDRYFRLANPFDLLKGTFGLSSQRYDLYTSSCIHDASMKAGRCIIHDGTGRSGAAGKVGRGSVCLCASTVILGPLILSYGRLERSFRA